MVKLAAYVEFRAGLENVAEVADALLPNELEMLHSLKHKYAEPLDPDPFDITALEVLVRNVEIRKGYRFDARKDGGRTIELPRVKD